MTAAVVHEWLAHGCAQQYTAWELDPWPHTHKSHSPTRLPSDTEYHVSAVWWGMAVATQVKSSVAWIILFGWRLDADGTPTDDMCWQVVDVRWIPTFHRFRHHQVEGHSCLYICNALSLHRHKHNIDLHDERRQNASELVSFVKKKFLNYNVIPEFLCCVCKLFWLNCL